MRVKVLLNETTEPFTVIEQVRDIYAPLTSYYVCGGAQLSMTLAAAFNLLSLILSGLIIVDKDDIYY